jgi:hypothetical protein
MHQYVSRLWSGRSVVHETPIESDYGLDSCTRLQPMHDSASRPQSTTEYCVHCVRGSKKRLLSAHTLRSG